MKKVLLGSLIALTLLTAAHGAEQLERHYVGVSDSSPGDICEVKIRSVGKKVTGFSLEGKFKNSDRGVFGFSLDHYDIPYSLSQGLPYSSTKINLTKWERSCMTVLCTTHRTNVDLSFDDEVLMKVELSHVSVGTLGLGYYSDRGTCSQFKQVR